MKKNAPVFHIHVWQKRARRYKFCMQNCTKMVRTMRFAGKFLRLWNHWILGQALVVNVTCLTRFNQKNSMEENTITVELSLEITYNYENSKKRKIYICFIRKLYTIYLDIYLIWNIYKIGKSLRYKSLPTLFRVTSQLLEMIDSRAGPTPTHRTGTCNTSSIKLINFCAFSGRSSH